MFYLKTYLAFYFSWRVGVKISHKLKYSLQFFFFVTEKKNCMGKVSFHRNVGKLWHRHTMDCQLK